MPDDAHPLSTTKFILSKIVACGLLILGLGFIGVGLSGEEKQTPFKAIGVGSALALAGVVVLLLKKNGKFFWQ